MPRPCKLALIGAGPWGRNYIRTITGMEHASLVAVASSNPETALLLPDTCRMERDWETIMGAEDVDGVIIATPPQAHVPIALAALETGKGVLVEKPVSLSASSTRALAGYSRRNPVLVGHIHLFSPAYNELKRLASEQGGAVAIRSTGGSVGPFREDTPGLWDWGPHDLAMALDLMDDGPHSIVASLQDERCFPEGCGRIYRIQLGFSGDRTAECTFGNAMQPKTRLLHVDTRLGTLTYDALGPCALAFTSATGTKQLPVPNQDISPLEAMVEAFCTALSTAEADREHIHLAVRVAEILEQADRQLPAS